MDERFHELAAQHEQELRDDAIQRTRRDMSSKGQPYCDECGEQIPEARRKANPAALRCIACQTVFEHLQKGVHHERHA